VGELKRGNSCNRQQKQDSGLTRVVDYERTKEKKGGEKVESGNAERKGKVNFTKEQNRKKKTRHKRKHHCKDSMRTKNRRGKMR